MSFFLWYIRFLAKLQLLKQKPLIIGLTGSAGKTSTLNAVEVILGNLANKKIKISHKANSEVGLPLNILGITVKDFSLKSWFKIFFLALWKLLTNWKKVDIYVAEMGIDSPKPPKNMGYLLSFLKPDIGIFLNASAVHSEPFDYLVEGKDPEFRAREVIHQIALEKGKLIEALPERGIAILNVDDSEVIAFGGKTKAEVNTFGTKESDLKLKDWKPSISGTTFTFSYLDQEFSVEFKDFALPKKFGLSLAAAILVGIKLDVPIDVIVSSLEEKLVIPPGRSSLFRGKKGSFVIDSSYNASFDPMIEMIDLLDKIAPKRKVAILGDMREMGEEASLAHKKVLEEAKKKVDLLILVGPLMKQAASKDIQVFENAQQATDFLKSKLLKDDTILVKGSQNTLLLEIAVEQLLNDPKQSRELCRRGAFWNKQRNKLIG